MKINSVRSLIALLLVLAFSVVSFGQTAAAISGKRAKRIVVRGGMVVDGSGKPAAGPFDIVIENDTITQIAGYDPRDPNPRRPEKGDVEIDAAGKYVLPGLINMHGHTQDERGGKPMPVEYVTKLWLACGITTVRDAWASKKVLEYRDKIASGTLVGPRIIAYGGFPAANLNTDAQVRQRVRDLKTQGFEGIKLYTMDRDLMAAMMDEAKKQGMRVMHHVGVEETNAWDNIRFGTTSIEHWYGIPDAAITSGRQNFPSNYNYNDEVDRFRYAGRLWREADPAKLDKVLQGMVDANVAWDPTLVIYEASRDLQRAQTNPAFAEYLHPVLEEYFRPNPSNHGSYFIGWSSTDETYWKENYRIWMKALYDFGLKGGVIGTGEDAGFIYQIYGFGLIRELELHQEAGFHPLKIIQHATSNGAMILGKEDTMGRIRVGYKADLIVVNGNPLENLKVLSPLGTEEVKDGKTVKTGGIEWTIRDGVPFHAPTLAADVRALVVAAKKK
ncbi:MAG: amidohydrolase family protein [Blastocatellia bacterium]|nr:amidohydrolase family protein [Blastocatellia bacterium]